MSLTMSVLVTVTATRLYRLPYIELLLIKILDS